MDEQRTAVVTAAAGGIGRAITQRLLHENYRVIAVDRDQQALDQVIATANSEALIGMTADLTQPGAVAQMFEQVGALGSLHVLVNGVGSTCGSPLHELSLANWQRLFDLNLTSVLLSTQAALPLMQCTHGDRVIINLSSTLAHIADPTTLAYGAFKAALEQMTRSLALELAPQNIRAVAIAPGPVADTVGEAAYESGEYSALNPLRRFAAPHEIAALVAFVASSDAAYITGTALRIDGGDSALGIGWGPLQHLLDRERS